MECNVATFLSELSNVIISDLKTYFQLISRDMFFAYLKNKMLLFFPENDTDAENCCLKNFLVSKSGRLRVFVGSWRVTIYKSSGEYSPRGKHCQQHSRDGVSSYFISTSQLCDSKMKFTLNAIQANVPFLYPMAILKVG